MCSSSTVDLARFCELDAENDALPEPTTNDEVVVFVRQTAEMIEEGAAVAPEEIRDEMRLAADKFGEIADLDDATEMLAAFESADPAVDEAADEVEAWVAENC